MLGSDAKIVRTMPNTPAQVGCGMTVISFNEHLTEFDKAIAAAVFESVGEVIHLPEKQINAAMALSGSSPAYVFMLIDAMADAGLMQGIPRNIACRLAAKAVEGSAKMVLESGVHPAELKNNVCSPGGATIEAVHSLEMDGFSAAIHNAVDACVVRGNKIGN